MKQESILHGDHQIAVSAPLADGQTGLSAGTVLYLTDGAYSGCKSTDVSSVQPAAVLLENIDGETADTQPQAVTVNKTESASLTVIAHSVDGGNLSYQKYARRTASP